MPERDKFASTITGKTWRSTLQDVERFITSETTAKMRKFLGDAPDLFGVGEEGPALKEQDVISAQAARYCLVAALSAREIAQSKAHGVDEEILAEHFLKVTTASAKQQKLLRERAALIQETSELLSYRDGSDDLLLREMGYTSNMNSDSEIVGITFEVLLPLGGYADFLTRMVRVGALAAETRGTAEHWGYEWCAFGDEDDIDVDEISETGTPDGADCLRLMCALGYYEKNDAGFKTALSNLCDYLITLHMGDMRTVCINGQEVRSIATGIGSLWWSALDGMRIGRLGACEVCGKPFIANNERGKKRKYCSEACKQWRKVHPGETRLNKDKPSTPEWVSMDR